MSSSTKDRIRIGLDTLPDSQPPSTTCPLPATVTTIAVAAAPDDAIGTWPSCGLIEQQLQVDNQRLSGALQTAEVQLTTKQRIIDDVLQSLQNSMRKSSDLQIQNEILQTKLHTDSIERERLKKASDWYRAQLHNVQKELRMAQWPQVRRPEDEDKSMQQENHRLKVELQKALSQCANVTQRLALEKERWLHVLATDHPVRPAESKDSGIFSESTSDSSSEVETISVVHPKLTDLEKELHHLQLRLDDESKRCQRLSAENGKFNAECVMLHQQVQFKSNLLEVQEKSLDQLREELKKTNEAMEGRRDEHERVVSYLTTCRQRVVELTQENSDVHRESLKMVLRFERIASLIAEYRQEICTKDNQLRQLAAQAQRHTVTDDKGSQTGSVRDTCEKGIQFNSPPSIGITQATGQYYKNLLRVIEREHQQKLQQRDVNMRTLMRKVREQMRVAKENANRHLELEAEVRLFSQRVLAADEGTRESSANAVLSANPGDLVEVLRKLANIVIPEESSLLVVECKSCVSVNESLKEATTQIAELLDTLVEQRVESEGLKAEIASLEAALFSKTESNESLEQTVRVLEMERRSVDCAVDILKAKAAEMEKQLLVQAKFKDSAESERKRYHQLMLLLIQIKNERDELLCQNEDLNRLLRGFLFVREQSPSITSKANEALKRCAKYRSSSVGLEPLSEGISSLRQEIKSLNSAILRSRGEVSLLDELEAIDQRPSF